MSFECTGPTVASDCKSVVGTPEFKQFALQIAAARRSTSSVVCTVPEVVQETLAVYDAAIADGLSYAKLKRDHSIHNGIVSYIIAREALRRSLDDGKIDPTLSFASGITHDVGQVLLPRCLDAGRDPVLCGDLGEATPDEIHGKDNRKELRYLHVDASEDFLRGISGAATDDLKYLEDIAGTHHVMHNGQHGQLYNNYPADLTGRDLPLKDRVGKAADHFAGMFDRGFSGAKPMPLNEAICEAMLVGDTELDPTALKLFIAAIYGTRSGFINILEQLSEDYKIGPNDEDGWGERAKRREALADLPAFKQALAHPDAKRVEVLKKELFEVTQKLDIQQVDPVIEAFFEKYC